MESSGFGLATRKKEGMASSFGKPNTNPWNPFPEQLNEYLDVLYPSWWQSPLRSVARKAWGMKEGQLFKCEPYLQIQMVNGSHSMWVPSINDVLSNDWFIVE